MKNYKKNRQVLMAEAETLLNSGDIEGYNAKETEIKKLDADYEAFTKAQANFNALNASAVVVPAVQNMGASSSVVLDNKQTPKVEDKYDTIEYRKAFMDYCKTGNKSEGFMNADEYTSTNDVGAVIPTTIVKTVIKEMKVYGEIYKRVRKSNIEGGVDVPVSAMKPVAIWINDTDNKKSDKQKVSANDKVSFKYHGLECKVAISLIASIVSLDMFEQEITQLILEAMVKAMDIAVVKGSGNGAPLGITRDSRVPEKNIITLSSADFVKWEAWKKKVTAKIPLAYRAGGSWIMAAGTFEGYIDGMVDANGQPIGRTNSGIDNGPKERFDGREVLLVEDDVIAPYESAATDDIVAVFCKLSDYNINSNMEMRMFRWLDHDENEYVDKAILVADGKILDPNGVIIVKKG